MTNAAATRGAWLFRYRSWIPPMVLGVLLAGLWSARAVPSAGLPRIPLLLGVGLAAVGLLVRGYAIGTAAPGTSGRNTRRQVADHLNTTGPYSIVRHPVYLGNLLTWLGLAVSTGVWWAVVLTGAAFAGFYRDIVVHEERFLAGRFGASYGQWAARTPRWVPGWRGWVPPAWPFACRIALRQEYYGWFTVTFFFVVLEMAARVIHEVRPLLAPGWIAVFVAVALGAAVLRYLQRRTTVLDLPGR
ncbi:MAG: hypothetical protein FJ206_02680 [Gemmatimonadetes bacterium]|nr:hypothetical protein [Gemmatimonadota bacterium]